jgi:hypothetical protein
VLLEQANLPLVWYGRLQQLVWPWCSRQRSAGTARGQESVIDLARAVAEAIHGIGLHCAAIGIVGLSELILVRDPWTIEARLSDVSFRDATMMSLI